MPTQSSMRRNIIALSLYEAAKFINEQEIAPPAPPSPMPPTTPAPPGEIPSTPPAPVGDATSVGVPTDEETGEPLTLDNILSRLNIIRSGKSFQDPEVYGKLTSIYKTMSPEDKQLLNHHLKSIGAIVQDQQPPQRGAATEPASPTAAPSSPAQPTPPAPPAA